MEHISVLLNECIEALNIKEDGIYVDGTLGRGGHSKEILRRLKKGHLYCFDIDQTAIDESKKRLEEVSNNFTIIKANFAEMKTELENRGVYQVDGILLDIGVSSPQFDDPTRGFSYRFDTKLDMRMDQSQALSAYNIVNEYSFNDLYYIFSRYGDEPYAKQIARNIESERIKKTIETTGQLVEIIKASLPAKVKNLPGNPTKKSFMGLRIAVNNELNNLQKAIEVGLKLLKKDGRFAIISFHSLEDEIVKHKFIEACIENEIDKRIILKEKDLPKAPFELVNKKPILASEAELNENHRSHSAKLRVIERKG